jgi:hypothetical protein
LTDEEFESKSAEWQTEWDATLAEVNTPVAAENADVEKAAAEKKRAEAQTRIQELYRKRSSFIQEEMTGFVWLYLQK